MNNIVSLSVITALIMVTISSIREHNSDSLLIPNATVSQPYDKGSCYEPDTINKILDDNCQKRADARLLRLMGYKHQSMLLLCDITEIKAAYIKAGKQCNK